MAHRFHDESSYLNYIIKNSKLIHEGPPALYRLTTTRSNLVEDGMIRKWTFGQQVLNKPNKTLLMVGETGTGKTALINAMANHALNVKFDDKIWFCITEENVDQKDQRVIKTIQITAYEIFGHDMPFSLTIIDTPGFGDTRGAEYDQKIATNLHRLFLNDTGVKEIDAVCLVVKAGMNRLSERQHYIFDAGLSLFGKDMENNIVICVTHSDGGPSTNAISALKGEKIPCRKDSKNEPVYFLFNNRQTEIRNPKFQKVYQEFWEQAEDSIKDLLTALEHHNKISINQTQDVLLKRIQLKACISNVQEWIEFTKRKKNELTEIHDILNKNEDKIRNNENLTLTVTECCKKKKKIHAWWFNKATTCSVCKENCHVPCKIAWNASWCKVMENGHCIVCTRKCPADKHVKEDQRYDRTREEKTLTFKTIKEELASNKEFGATFSYDQKEYKKLEDIHETTVKEKEKMMSTMDKVNEEITRNEKNKTELLKEASNTIMSLHKIALKPDSAFIIESLDILISSMEEAEWLQKLRELRNVEPEVECKAQSAQSYFKANLSMYAVRNMAAAVPQDV